MEAKKADASYERLGSKRLALPDVVAQSVGFMGPVFSAAFVLPLVVGVISATGKGGGVASPISVLVAAVGIFALSWIVARYAKEVRAAGSLYEYVSRGLGARIGLAAGWLYFTGVIALTAVLPLLIGAYIRSNLASDFSVNPLPAWAWTLIVLAGVGAVLYFGVRLSTRAQLALALTSILVMTGFFAMVIVKLGKANSIAPFKPSSAIDGWSGILFGVLYGVLLFTGFETSANLAEETAHPHRHIPMAVLLSAGIAAVFFVLAAYVEVAGFHYSLKAITSAATAPIVALGRSAKAGGYGGTWIDRLLELIILFDMLAVTIGTGVSASRGIFAMARDRRIPAPLARVSKRYGTPVGATLLVVGAAVAVLLLNQFWTGLFALPKTPHYFAMFSWGATFGGFCLVVVYLLMAIGSLHSFAHSTGRFWLIASAIVGILMTGGAIYGAFDKVSTPTLLAPWFAIIWLVVGFGVAFLTKGRTPASLQLPDLAVNPDLARTESLDITGLDPASLNVTPKMTPVTRRSQS